MDSFYFHSNFWNSGSGSRNQLFHPEKQFTKKRFCFETIISYATPTPKYSFKVLKTPVLNTGFNFSIEFSNLTYEPYINNFSIGVCQFIDKDGNKYSGAIHPASSGEVYSTGEVFFNKGLKPGESKIFDFKNVSVTLDGGGGINPNNPAEMELSRCNWDKEGNKVCSPVKGIKFVDCTATVNWSADNKGAIIFPQ